MQIVARFFKNIAENSPRKEERQIRNDYRTLMFRTFDMIFICEAKYRDINEF